MVCTRPVSQDGHGDFSQVDLRLAAMSDRRQTSGDLCPLERCGVSPLAIRAPASLVHKPLNHLRGEGGVAVHGSAGNRPGGAGSVGRRLAWSRVMNLDIRLGP